ncbi:hypothetical protein KVR01_009935 [Diaporthe batatas]|uniref:uncharacterized protein n=1 Tax=Diaporthe batatas TaxID=748121 RepID=UPI001D043CB2|nr:uncharacterized protein KVR01_009935 [Diaporthe batatas]KAG8160399.1 hypothetical protein KVR01_009935 [Diaporthe batatas]
MSPLPTFFRLAHPDGPVLVRVAPRSSTKSRPLDLELRATDDVRAFVLPLQHSKISRYRRDASSLSDEEWESCLTSLLLGTGPIGELDVSAKFTGENLDIEIGKRVSGATDVAGTLVLRPSKSATKNADMFAWASEAVLRQAQLAEELAELKLKHDHLEKRVDDETAKLKALAHSKNDFESEHNSFFRDLINEKKLKIRTQEQILATARVDEAKLAALKARAEPAKSEAISRHPGAAGSSRKGKRKAESHADDADGADLDGMDIDKKSVISGQELYEIDQATEEDTASEHEPDSEPKPASKSNKPSNLHGNATVVTANEDEEMPAPRALPFGRKAEPTSYPADDESTASES